MRSTDGVTDTTDPATRRYIERVILAGADGRASAPVKPGSYAIFVSRGPEYDAFELKRWRRIDILDNSCDDNVDIAVDYDDFLDRASNDNHR